MERMEPGKDINKDPVRTGFHDIVFRMTRKIGIVVGTMGSRRGRPMIRVDDSDDGHTTVTLSSATTSKVSNKSMMTESNGSSVSDMVDQLRLMGEGTRGNFRELAATLARHSWLWRRIYLRLIPFFLGQYPGLERMLLNFSRSELRELVNCLANLVPDEVDADEPHSVSDITVSIVYAPLETINELPADSNNGPSAALTLARSARPGTELSSSADQATLSPDSDVDVSSTNANCGTISESSADQATLSPDSDVDVSSTNATCGTISHANN